MTAAPPRASGGLPSGDEDEPVSISRFCIPCFSFFFSIAMFICTVFVKNPHDIHEWLYSRQALSLCFLARLWLLSCKNICQFSKRYSAKQRDTHTHTHMRHYTERHNTSTHTHRQAHAHARPHVRGMSSLLPHATEEVLSSSSQNMHSLNSG